MGTHLHAAVTALIQHQQHPCNHLRDVVLKGTKDFLEVALVIESDTLTL